MLKRRFKKTICPSVIIQTKLAPLYKEQDIWERDALFLERALGRSFDVCLQLRQTFENANFVLKKSWNYLRCRLDRLWGMPGQTPNFLSENECIIHRTLGVLYWQYLHTSVIHILHPTSKKIKHCHRRDITSHHLFQLLWPFKLLWLLSLDI